MEVKVLVLTGFGINAEKELKWAFDLAGGKTDIVHLEKLIENKEMLKDYQILAFPGGFSFGDHIASGKVFANIIKYNLLDEIKEFISENKLVIGICNGFQVITKLGLVPAMDDDYTQTASLIENDSAKFEDRWVWVKIENSNSPWLKGLDKLYLPIRHGEGKFVTQDDATLEKLLSNSQVAIKYTTKDDKEPVYPQNPNGSYKHIAGITNTKGNVFGLMPHPEAYIFDQNHPNWTEGVTEKHTGLAIFKNAINHFK